MGKVSPHSVVVPLDWREPCDHWGLFPSGQGTKGPRRRFKALTVRKGNCAFTRDVPRGMIEFIYRAVTRLGLRERRLAFTRGMVRKGAFSLTRAVAVRELGWGAGSAVVIPRALRFGERIQLLVDGEPAILRVMDLVVLNALLRLARPCDRPDWYPAMAAAIVSRGWKSLERTDIPPVIPGKDKDGKSPRKRRRVK
ncbi:MAG TPA: hypothetical protein VLM75_10900 [Spirochaetota bacterium]|nr:hypothetical protein [Spirochaetota bacterium]